MIEITDLYKYYGDYRAIGPISVTIERGQVVGLLGLNGAGKTTTLRILACDLLPTSGQVRIDGIDVINEPERIRAKVGYLPDNPPLYGEMTVREYLRFAGRLRGVSSKEIGKRVAEVLGLTELSSVADTTIQTLSHGFRQRVGIAQTIVHQPVVVVLDEPISGLDPVQIVEMRQLIRNLREDHAVVISSHILSEISETCDRILVIRDGQIAASGTEAELSAQLHGGMTIDVTVNRPERVDEADVVGLLAKLNHVERVELVAQRESGDRITSLRVTMANDVRQTLVTSLTGAGCTLLELARTQRELENVFLQLSEVRIGVTPSGSAGASMAKRSEELS
ncbi:MAG TPA: ABC transporter ATP-binding protein [Polyangiaceae bacterium]